MPMALLRVKENRAYVWSLLMGEHWGSLEELSSSHVATMLPEGVGFGDRYYVRRSQLTRDENRIAARLARIC